VRSGQVGATRSKLLYLKRKHIADAALRLDDAGRTGIGLKLSPQSVNLRINAAVEYVLLNACCLQKMFSTEWSLRRIDERDQ
jgi:hypothetical protein